MEFSLKLGYRWITDFSAALLSWRLIFLVGLLLCQLFISADTAASAQTADQVQPQTEQQAQSAHSSQPPAPSHPATESANKVNKADIAWMMLASILVILMTLPGLGLFYGGLVRSKNMLSMLMQCMVIFSLVVVLWSLYGYSLAFTEGNMFYGGWQRLFLMGLSAESVAATFSKGVFIPEYLFFLFQGAFAGIACALIVGAIAERAKFAAVLLFVVLWFSFSYIPLAHMVWFWPGPDAFTDAVAAEKALASSGWLFQRGALDFAGGTVIHINAAVAGLVGAYVVGRRIGLGKEMIRPHNLTFTVMGAAMLWFGWFGFNGGSALEANGSAALAMVNTLLAGAAAVLAWILVEWVEKKRPSMLGAASGAVSGLVTITPAAGFVGPMGALLMGALGSVACWWGVTKLKEWLRVDDSLDVFGIHGVGGIVGALLTGIFASPALGGTGLFDYVANAPAKNYDLWGQVWIQAEGVLITVLWSAAVSWLAFWLIDKTIGLRVSKDDEREGLDLSSHGETAYND